MLVLRRVGAILLAIAAVAVWFLLAPSTTVRESSDFSSEISDALADYEANNTRTQGAPQQQVVNGWIAKDRLTILARQQDAALSPQTAPRDDRVPAELLLLVLGVALIAATSGSAERRDREAPAASASARTDGRA